MQEEKDYIAIVQLKLKVTAPNKRLARKYISENPPFVDVAGITLEHPSHYHSVRTVSKAKVISLIDKHGR